MDEAHTARGSESQPAYVKVDVPREALDPITTVYQAEGHDDVTCAPSEGRHGHTCPAAPFAPELYTKGTFVAGAEAAAHSAIWTYLYARAEMGMDHAEALEQAVQEVSESAGCFAGIGSCGMGWCEHG